MAPQLRGWRRVTYRTPGGGQRTVLLDAEGYVCLPDSTRREVHLPTGATAWERVLLAPADVLAQAPLALDLHYGALVPAPED